MADSHGTTYLAGPVALQQRPARNTLALPNGTNITTSQDLIEYCEAAATPEDRHARALEAESVLNGAAAQWEGLNIDWAEYLDRAIRDTVNPDEYQDQFEGTMLRRKDARTKEGEHAQKLAAVRARWPEVGRNPQHPVVYNHSKDALRSTSELSKVSALANNMQYVTFTRALARAYMYRQEHAARQGKAPKSMQQPMDIDTINSGKVAGDPFTADEHRKLEVEYDLGFSNVTGLAVPLAENPGLRSITRVGSEGAADPATETAAEPVDTTIIDTDVAGDNEAAAPPEGGIASRLRKRTHRRAQEYSDEEDEEEDVEEEEEEEEEEVAPAKRQRVANMKRRTPTSCICDGEVTDDVKEWCEYQQPENDEYKEIFVNIINWCKKAKDEYGHILLCRYHLMLPAQAVGYHVHNESNDGILAKLRQYVDAPSISALHRTAPACYGFNQSVRAPRAIDHRGGWKYAPESEPEFDFDAQKVCEFHFPGMWDQFQEDGTLNYPLFEWLFEEEYSQDGVLLGDLMHEEFDMYYHHFHRRANEGDQGWIRNAFHTLAQQVLRQDLSYYIAYCCLRPDKACTLISYPYYAKYTHPGSATFFRHMDINPAKLAAGNGRFMIQGSVSLTDEIETNCTELVLGMHKWATEWWSDVGSRGDDEKSSGEVINFKGTNLITQSDKDKFNGFVFTPVPCRRGDARISHPALAHGSTGPATNHRITILPWFVKAAGNGSLEVPEAGTWDELSAAHRDLTNASRTPSGRALFYGATKASFPVAMPLLVDAPISGALVGRLGWKNPLVLRQRSLLLDTNRGEEAKDVIRAARKQVAARVFELWAVMKEEERRIYGEKSYVVCKEKGTFGTAAAPPPDDPDPDLEGFSEEDDVAGEEDATVARQYGTNSDEDGED